MTGKRVCVTTHEVGSTPVMFRSSDTLDAVAGRFHHDRSSNLLDVKTTAGGGLFIALPLNTELARLRDEGDLEGDGSGDNPFIVRVERAGAASGSGQADVGAGAGAAPGHNHKRSHGGNKSLSGSPSGPAVQAPKRSVAFGSSKHLLEHYCPKLVMRRFNEGMDKLLQWQLEKKQEGIFRIKPRDYDIPQDVLDYLLPQLQAFLLGLDICSENEASSVLKIYEVIKLLLRCCPWTKLGARLTEPEQDKLDVEEGGQEASSSVFKEQQIAHEAWQREPGFVKGRVELQIVCDRADGTKYYLGACEVASNLSTADLLNTKLQQVAKEAFAFAVKNAKEGHSALPVKMLLTDGKRFMRVDLNLTTNYVQGMDLHQLAGDFTFSAPYSILWHEGVTKEDSYDALRVLLSWMWHGQWKELSVDLLKQALAAAHERDKQALADRALYYVAEGAKRRRIAPGHPAS